MTRRNGGDGAGSRRHTQHATISRGGQGAGFIFCCLHHSSRTNNPRSSDKSTHFVVQPACARGSGRQGTRYVFPVFVAGASDRRYLRRGPRGQRRPPWLARRLPSRQIRVGTEGVAAAVVAHDAGRCPCTRRRRRRQRAGRGRPVGAPRLRRPSRRASAARARRARRRRCRRRACGFCGPSAVAASAPGGGGRPGPGRPEVVRLRAAGLCPYRPGVDPSASFWSA